MRRYLHVAAGANDFNINAEQLSNINWWLDGDELTDGTRRSRFDDNVLIFRPARYYNEGEWTLFQFRTFHTTASGGAGRPLDQLPLIAATTSTNRNYWRNFEAVGPFYAINRHYLHRPEVYYANDDQSLTNAEKSAIGPYVKKEMLREYGDPSDGTKPKTTEISELNNSATTFEVANNGDLKISIPSSFSNTVYSQLQHLAFPGSRYIRQNTPPVIEAGGNAGANTYVVYRADTASFNPTASDCKLENVGGTWTYLSDTCSGGLNSDGLRFFADSTATPGQKMELQNSSTANQGNAGLGFVTYTDGTPEYKNDFNVGYNAGKNVFVKDNGTLSLAPTTATAPGDYTVYAVAQDIFDCCNGAGTYVGHNRTETEIKIRVKSQTDKGDLTPRTVTIPQSDPLEKTALVQAVRNGAFTYASDVPETAKNINLRDAKNQVMIDEASFNALNRAQVGTQQVKATVTYADSSTDTVFIPVDVTPIDVRYSFDTKGSGWRDLLVGTNRPTEYAPLKNLVKPAYSNQQELYGPATPATRDQVDAQVRALYSADDITVVENMLPFIALFLVAAGGIAYYAQSRRRDVMDF